MLKIVDWESIHAQESDPPTVWTIVPIRHHANVLADFMDAPVAQTYKHARSIAQYSNAAFNHAAGQTVFTLGYEEN